MAERPGAAPLILVVGMHRSGSSLLGSVLRALGVGLPGPLIPGDLHNPEGYFERADITALQEELLIDLVRWWPAPEGVLPLPRGWLTGSRGQRASRGLRRLLTADAAEARGPWAIKDPRISLLLPLWRQVADGLGIPLRLVLAVRDPAEVVVSLLGRDGDTAGMTLRRAQQLWWRHQHQVLQDGAGLPLLVVPYADWFRNPEAQIAAVARFCGVGTLEPHHSAQALACIRPEHHRSRRSQLPCKLDPSLPVLYGQLCRAARDHRRSIGIPDHTRRWLLLCTRSRIALHRGRDRVMNRYPFPLHHPWARAAQALETDQTRAQQRLETWQARGFSANDLERLTALRRSGLPGDDPAALDGGPLEAPLQVHTIGGGPEHWPVHLWLERLPTSRTEPWQLKSTDPEQARFALHLQPLATTASDPSLLLSLTRCARVFDPDPERVRILRFLGVAAEPIDPTGAVSSGWLLRPGDQEAASVALGLPSAEQLLELQRRCLCLGASDDPAWLDDPLPDVLRIPCFPPQPATSGDQARVLASWLESCRQAGLQLVRLNPPMVERQALAAQALGMPIFEDPISPRELEQELAWMAAGSPATPPAQTPTPGHRIRWSLEQRSAVAAVCISLYNYQHCIEAALDSCAEQTLADLELLVVDDGSNDGGAERCERWLERRGHRFSRALLVQHDSNSGLAAARNTAFALAEAPWCFVLDADNLLAPRAVEHCLAIATRAAAQVAVVHPLVRRITPDGKSAGLVGGGHAWQRDLLMAGNVVDAMALVRRTAWQRVGGYAHIPGGWEDFDFWCCLIDAGFHGVLCPEIQATYHIHASSMLQSTTNGQLRRISRLVQQRHPWLQLGLAAPNR